MKNPDHSQDVVQETFLRLCAHPELEGSQNLPAWLYKVCRNLAIDNARYEQKILPIERATPLSSAPDAMELKKDAAVALRCIEALPQVQREVVKLRLLHELSYREIAEVTGRSVGTIGYQIHEGLNRLRAELSEPTNAKEQAG